MKYMRLLISLGLGVLLTVIDQLTKQWALAVLSAGKEIKLLSNFLTLKLTFNAGAAFSLGNNVTIIFTIFAIVAMLAIPIVACRTTRFFLHLLAAVIWAGVVGNLLDRIFRQPSVGSGHVVDFINYNDWFIGNVADIFLVLGMLVFFVYYLRLPEVEKNGD